MKDIKNGEVDVNSKALGAKDKNEINAVRTAMKRLWFAQENGMCAEEVYFRSRQLKNAAHTLFLKNHGYIKRGMAKKNSGVLHAESAMLPAFSIKKKKYIWVLEGYCEMLKIIIGILVILFICCAVIGLCSGGIL